MRQKGKIDIARKQAGTSRLLGEETNRKMSASREARKQPSNKAG